MQNLLIFGGTFDPVHNGHLNIALNVQNYFNFEQFIFLPCKIPLLKNNSIAPPLDRLNMLEIALQNYRTYQFLIDTREIFRESASYTIDTLRSYRAEYGKLISINLLIGEDTFNQIPQWHEWPLLLELTNFLVVKRAGINHSFCSEINELLKNKEINDPNLLTQQANGAIFRFNAGAYDLSSTNIRKILKDGSTNLDLPSSVLHYIKKHHLYC